MNIRSEMRRMLRQGGRPEKPYEPMAPPPDRTDGMAWWERGLDYLNRPAAASAGFAKSLLSGGNPWRSWLRNFTGEESTSFQDVLRASGMDKGLARATLGFALDVVADPTSWISFGAGAGVKATVGGVSKTLTKAGGAAKTALAAQKAARLTELIPQLAAKNPAALDRLITLTGLSHLKGSWVSKAVPHELMAKEAADRIASRSIGKAIEGKAVPAGIEALIGKAGAKELVQPTAVRFMGAPIPYAKEAIQAPFKVAGAAYKVAEKLPVIGKPLSLARQGVEAGIEATKKVFSTASGMPEFDEIFRRKRSILDFDTNQFIGNVREQLIKPMRELKRLGKGEYDTALKEIREFHEGVIVTAMQEIPDVVKAERIQTQLSRLNETLGRAELALKGAEERTFLETAQSALNREVGAREIAKRDTIQAAQAHKGQFGRFLEELKTRGVGPGDIPTEWKLNVPKKFRRGDGTPIDVWVDNLKREHVLPETATEKDFFNLIQKAMAKPSKVTPEQVLAKLPQPKIAQVDPTLKPRVEGLKATVAKKEAELATLPPKTVPIPERVRVEPSRREAAAVANIMKEGYEKMLSTEGKLLVNSPDAMRFYFPHFMRDEVRELLVQLVPSEMRKLLKPEHSGLLGQSMRRTAQGSVSEVNLADLVSSGALDASKVQDYLKSKGLNLSADDLLVFETDPIKAFIKRGLASIRATNAAELAREVMESPGILKAKFSISPSNARDISRTLGQHPGHAAFLATKQFVERFKTPAEREAMKRGAEKALQQTFIHEVDPTWLENVLKNAEQHAGVEVYILPREVATHLSRAYSMQFDEQAIADFLRYTDKMTSWWKAFATVWRPGFHVRNEISNAWQMVLGGLRSPEPAIKAFLAMTRKPERAGNVGRYTAAEALALADRFGMRRTGFVGGDVDDLIKRELEPNLNPLSTSGPLIRAGSAVATGFEDHAKVTLFFDQLAKGADPVSASMHVKKYLFDYSDLTIYERTFFRRLIPFYTFTRKSIPLAIETVLTKPGYASALGKIREAGEKNVEDPLKDEYVSSWIKEGLGVPVRKTSDGKTEFFLLKGWIPLADLAKMDVQEAFGMLHPAFKAPIELAMNRSVFTGRPIERFPGQKEKFIGVPMRAQAAHLLRNLVFMQELDRLFFKEEFDAARSAVGALGFRTYKQDKVVQMRSRVYELQSQMGDLKNVISLATKRHGADSSLVKQAEERLQLVIADRDRVKADLLEIDPEALSTRKKDGPPKEKKLPTTMEGFRRSIDLDRLLAPRKAGQ